MNPKNPVRLPASSLMVGDYIQTYDDAVIVRVVSVNPHSVLVEDGKEIESMHERDLAPLPLDTALDLMGFKEGYTGIAGVKDYTKQADKCDDESYVSLMYWEKTGNYYLRRADQIALRNVHELQHLLRLIGFKWESDIIEFEE